MDAAIKEYYSLMALDFVKESKKLPEVRKKIMMKTSTAQAKETKKKNKTTN